MVAVAMFFTRSSQATELFLTSPTFRWIFRKSHRNHSNSKSTDSLLIRFSRPTSSEHLEARVTEEFQRVRGSNKMQRYSAIGERPPNETIAPSVSSSRKFKRFYPRHVGDRSSQEPVLFGENDLNRFPEGADTVEKTRECFDDVVDETLERINH